MRALIERLLSVQPLRRLTDRPVKCERCGGHMGFMTFMYRRDRWRHKSCYYVVAPVVDQGRIGPVGATGYVVDDATAVHIKPDERSHRPEYASRTV